MTLKMLKPRQGGGFTEKFRLTQPKHVIRVYPFKHGEEDNLAALDFMHFGGPGEPPSPCLGSGCPICLQANKTANKRLRKVTRYPMLVVDIESDTSKLIRFDAPASVYKQIYSILEEGSAEDYLGDSGMDFIIKTNAGSQPSDRYNVTLRVKGSAVLEIGDATIDLIEEVEHDREPIADEETVEEEEGVVETEVVTCPACKGKGKNSKGGKCVPCQGSGKIEVDPTTDDSTGTDEPETPKTPSGKTPPVKGKKGTSAPVDLWADDDTEGEGTTGEGDATEEPAPEEENPLDSESDIMAKDKVMFTQGGKNIKGTFTGKFRQNKMVIEANGQLWTIEPEKVTKV